MRPVYSQMSPKYGSFANSGGNAVSEQICFDNSQICPIKTFKPIAQNRLNNIIDSIANGFGQTGKAFLTYMNNLSVECHAKIMLVNYISNSGKDNRYLSSNIINTNNTNPPSYLLYVIVPQVPKMECNIYIYNKAIVEEDKTKEPLQQKILKDGTGNEANSKIIWLGGIATTEAYIVAHELSHIAARFIIIKNNPKNYNSAWKDYINDIDSFFNKSNIYNLSENEKRIFLKFFSNAEEARTTIFSKAFGDSDMLGECDFFKSIIADKPYLLLHSGQKSSTQEERQLLSRIFDCVNNNECSADKGLLCNNFTIVNKDYIKLQNEIQPTWLDDYGYKLLDVPKDGNCGAWAIMAKIGQAQIDSQDIDVTISNIDRPTQEDYEKMRNFRDKVSCFVQDNEDTKNRIRGANNNWLIDEDFTYFARALNRNIIVVQNDKTAHLYTPSETSFGQFDAFIKTENPVIIYHNDHHYQALVKRKDCTCCPTCLLV